MKEISRRQFDAYCYVRGALIREIIEEIAWFEAGDRKLLATITLDKIDEDYGYVLLGRDLKKLFRCIASSQNYETSEQAKASLFERVQKYLNDGCEYYPQGDEVLAPNEMFHLRGPAEKLHPYFKLLMEEERFEAARNLIKEIAYSFVDVDGNYIEQFQTEGFNSRLWELFLHAFLCHSGFEFERSQAVPDFCINKLGYKCFIEAVSIRESPKLNAAHPRTSEEVCDLSKDYLPIKYAGVLFNKMRHEPPYWELEHVQDHPFIFAIHDYHLKAESDALGSMTWSRAGLSNYLYGVRDEVEFDEEGRIASILEETPNGLSIKTVKITEHRYKDKTIPSNFFSLPNTENVSAVLFSNGATISTFNRMGKLAGLGSKNVIMIRRGVKASPDPHIAPCIPFEANIDSDAYEEAWSDTVVMYHNPNARIPVSPEAFPDITHITCNEEGEFLIMRNPHEVFSSCTHVIIPKAGVSDS